MLYTYCECVYTGRYYLTPPPVTSDPLSGQQKPSLEPGRLIKGAWKRLHAPKFPKKLGNMDTVVNLLVKLQRKCPYKSA